MKKLDGKINIKKFIDNFNNDFKTNIKINNLNFLNKLFNQFINENMSEIINSDEIHQMTEIEENLELILDDNGKNMFKKWNDIQNKYMYNFLKQTFIYGICTYAEIQKEINNCNKI